MTGGGDLVERGVHAGVCVLFGALAILYFMSSFAILVTDQADISNSRAGACYFGVISHAVNLMGVYQSID